jgi:hypothetical protein
MAYRWRIADFAVGQFLKLKPKSLPRRKRMFPQPL